MTAYGMRISDWSSDVCSSDLREIEPFMRLDQIDIDSAGAGRECDAEIEIGPRVAARRVEQPAFDQILGRLQTVRHDNPLCLPPQEAFGQTLAVYGQQSVNCGADFWG